MSDRLKESDLIDVQRKLHAVTTSWYNLGLELGLKVPILDLIDTKYHSDPSQCFRDVLKEWLRGIDPLPTWKSVVIALKSPTVGEHQLAEEIEIQHLSLTPTQLSSSQPPPPVASAHPQPSDRLSVSDLADVQRELYAINTRWYDLGLELGLQAPSLHSIFSKHPGDTSQCFREVLKVWLKGVDPPPTWELLEKARKSLAPNIQPRYLNISNPLEDYREALRNAYLQCGEEVPAFGDQLSSFPPVCKKKSVHLALVKLELADLSREKLARETIRDSVDDIIHKKVDIEFEKIFEFENGSKGARILIEGRPGSGKTTLMGLIGRQWASQKILQDCIILLLVPLRRLLGIKQIKIEDLLGEHFPPETISGIIDWITKSAGKGVCFAVDGVDEHPGASTKDGDLFKLFLGEKLPNSTVILASRPAATEPLRKHAANSGRYIEVIGFLKDDIVECITQYYEEQNNVSKSTELLKYLENHPDVMHMCYLPINLIIIIWLFDNPEGSSLPESETEIYEKCTILTLTRHVNKLDSDIVLQLDTLNDIYQVKSTEIQKGFFKICQLAFQGRLEDKLLLTETEKDFLPSTASHLGLLTVDFYWSSSRIFKERTYSFLHLTFQEFLAAFYITTLESNDQLEIARATVPNPRMSEVLKFYAGLTKLKGHAYKVFQITLYHHNNLAAPTAIATLTGAVFGVIQSIWRRLAVPDTTVIAASNETTDIRSVERTLLRCVFEARSVEGSHELTSGLQGIFNFKSKTFNFPLTPYDSSALGFTLFHNHQAIKELNLRDCYMGPTGLSAILQQLGNTTLPKLVELEIAGNSLGQEAENAQLVNSFLEKSPNLEFAHLGRNNFGTAGVLALLPTLKRLNKLRVVKFSDSELDDDGAVGLAEAFAEGNWPDLKELWLHYNLVGNRGFSALAHGLKNHSKLEGMWLGYNKCGDEGAICFAKALKECWPHLVQFRVQSNEITETGKGILNQTIEQKKHSTKLDPKKCRV